jgi:hypothetical protein
MVGHSRLTTRLILLIVLWAGGAIGLSFGGAARAENVDHPATWEAWTSESYSLRARESFQMRVDFEDMPVRRWKLTVEGGDRNCDLSLLRVKGEELLYFKTDESRHAFSIPWGQGEELLAVLTNREIPGSFVVTLWGPPRKQVTAAYSYHVNRALEDFAGGQRLAAEDQCRLALKANPDDVVAKVLFAGFQRDRQAYDQAAALVDEALAGPLPEDMRTLAESMRAELVQLRAPLPAPVRRGVNEAEELIGQGNGAAALDVCERLLDGALTLEGPSRSRILSLKGQALELEGRNFEAVDAFTHALNFDRSHESQAIIFFHMGRLFRGMENLAQAQGAFTIALQHGLPSALDMQARELLKDVESQLAGGR